MTGPAEDGIRFRITVRTEDFAATPDAFQVTVRAWSLQEACRKAAELPLIEWDTEAP